MITSVPIPITYLTGATGLTSDQVTHVINAGAVPPDFKPVLVGGVRHLSHRGAYVVAVAHMAWKQGIPPKVVRQCLETHWPDLMKRTTGALAIGRDGGAMTMRRDDNTTVQELMDQWRQPMSVIPIATLHDKIDSAFASWNRDVRASAAATDKGAA